LVFDVLEIVVALEANAYDRHLKMLDAIDDEDARQGFEIIVREEKMQLESHSEVQHQNAQEVTL
jgi:hypothetical protein